MYFKYKEGTVDVDFHRNDLGFFTGTMCGVIEKYLENFKSHKKFCIFCREVGEYESFWELLKMNLLENQTVNLMVYRIRSNTIRLEESTGRVSFTNNQTEVELYINKVIKNKEAILGDLRMRKGNDE
jgi:Fic family protein